MKNNKGTLSVLVILTGLFLSCGNNNLQPKVLNIVHYRLMVSDPNNPITVVTLLHAYPMKKLNSSNLTAVNLYVCKGGNGRDSMFVFDVNRPPGKQYFDDEGPGFIINKSTIKDIKSQSIIINVPSNFRIPSNIEYVFARIDRTAD
ncbi:hypothetical protein [Mucilaginibacter sp. OK098]|uniref:hypothetical protein n=1 Tax=Mucilaginibacter sp. OK098 TaxID=1855297 RepID=UPI00091EC3BB|nr:hypothetical protein [Mucilaginibacter sp. OK098]SHM83361.1 hypothetical protein SAMN05216524_103606 [Mucilaginibacter sp. OK098]